MQRTRLQTRAQRRRLNHRLRAARRRRSPGQTFLVLNGYFDPSLCPATPARANTHARPHARTLALPSARAAAANKCVTLPANATGSTHGRQTSHDAAACACVRACARARARVCVFVFVCARFPTSAEQWPPRPCKPQNPSTHWRLRYSSRLQLCNTVVMSPRQHGQRRMVACITTCRGRRHRHPPVHVASQTPL
jgi:hypothetical protein